MPYPSTYCVFISKPGNFGPKNKKRGLRIELRFPGSQPEVISIIRTPQRSLCSSPDLNRD
ncbi:hypothetical protein AAMO2058_000748600 [Amorphochlora amoebiformis]